MSFWPQLRILFLAVTLSSVLFVLFRVILISSPEKPAAERQTQTK